MCVAMSKWAGDDFDWWLVNDGNIWAPLPFIELGKHSATEPRVFAAFAHEALNGLCFCNSFQHKLVNLKCRWTMVHFNHPDSWFCNWGCFKNLTCDCSLSSLLDGDFNYLLFSPLFGKFLFWLYNMFQMGWNHQLLLIEEIPNNHLGWLGFQLPTSTGDRWISSTNRSSSLVVGCARPTNLVIFWYRDLHEHFGSVFEKWHSNCFLLGPIPIGSMYNIYIYIYNIYIYLYIIYKYVYNYLYIYIYIYLQFTSKINQM